MKKAIIVFFLVTIILFTCGCMTEEVTDSPSENHVCVDCGKQANHYMGDIWQNYETVELYYCDECYENLRIAPGTIMPISP